MTKVDITYNPFAVKSDIEINGEAIQNTSSLFRYRNTPMQDWVSSFLPDLVEHCNDDEIEIYFHGLQFDFDDLEEQVQRYCNNNRDVEITLKDDISKSLVARIGMLSTIIDEAKNLDNVFEFKNDVVTKKITDSFFAKLEVIVSSGNDALKADLVNRLIGKSVVRESSERGVRIIDNDSIDEIKILSSEQDFDIIECNFPFSNTKYASLHIIETPNNETQSDCYYRYTKKIITSAVKNIVIFVLDKNAATNNEEFLSLISEQFKPKDKQNKDRFIFVAENTALAKKYLYSNYAIKDAQVFSVDDITEIQSIINRYMEKYCLIEKIKSLADTMLKIIEDIRISIQNSIDSSDKLLKLDNVYFSVISNIDENKALLKDIIDNYCKEDANMSAHIHTMYSDLTRSYSNSLYDLINEEGEKVDDNAVEYLTNIFESEFKNRLDECFRSIAPPLSIRQLNNSQKMDDSLFEAQMPDIPDIDYEIIRTEVLNESLELLTQIEIEDGHKFYRGYTYLKKDLVNYYLNEFSRGKTIVQADGKHLVYTANYNLIEGIKYFSLNSLMQEKTLTESLLLRPKKDRMEDSLSTFEYILWQSENILKSQMQKYQEEMNCSIKKEFEPYFDKLEQHKEKVKLKYDELKKQAKIAELDQKRLYHIDDLSEKLVQIMKI